jgi:hypothetical protein
LAQTHEIIQARRPEKRQCSCVPRKERNHKYACQKFSYHFVIPRHTKGEDVWKADENQWKQEGTNEFIPVLPWTHVLTLLEPQFFTVT